MNLDDTSIISAPNVVKNNQLREYLITVIPIKRMCAWNAEQHFTRFGIQHEGRDYSIVVTVIGNIGGNMDQLVSGKR